ncbi:MAG: bifunctional nicotinamidase/pyrazinamidase [Phycisphaerae bacterium]
MNALIVVDVQNDFVAGGALAVREGDRVIPVINQLMPRFRLVVATQDWHPPDHRSFAANHPGAHVGDVIDLHGLAQVLWPVHCVQDTRGAAFVATLDAGCFARVFRKGVDRDVDSYSGFFDNGRRRATGLGDFLLERGVDSVFVCGLATDYCVKFTALDARALGFRTTLVRDACRGVELKAGDVEAAVAEMERAEVRMIASDEVAAAR